jgi:hypothetical protein
MRFIRRLIIATAQWVALLSILVVTFSGGVFGWFESVALGGLFGLCDIRLRTET